MSTAPPAGTVSIRRARLEDAPVCASICWRAFDQVSTRHHFPPDLPSLEGVTALMSEAFCHPGFYCVVAEADGRVIGSNCMDERNSVAGIGPVTVDPGAQDRGVGRKLMEAALERARNFPGVRLVHAAFHDRALAFYSGLGFDVKEPLSVMQGPAIARAIEGYRVRAAQASDRQACNQVCRQVHGHDRGGELESAIEQGAARVVERNGRITGYTSVMAFFGHAVAESNPDLEALIAAAESFGGPGILVPTRNSALFRWCLANGLRVVQPMTLMARGLYSEPAGAFLPSILY